MQKVSASRRKFLWVLLLMGSLLLLAMVYQVFNWYGERSWQEYLRSSDRRDAELKEQYLAIKIPEEQNFAKTPLLERHAYKGRGSPGALFASVPLPATEWGDFRRGVWRSFKGQNGSIDQMPEEEKKAAGDYLASFEPARHELAELFDASKRPYSRFDSGLGYESVIPKFVFIRTLVQSCAWRAHAHLLLANPEVAFAELMVVNRTAEGLDFQPTLVCAMIDVAVRGVDKQVFYEGWARRQWTREHYERFQNEFAKADLLRNFDTALRLGEKAGVQAMVEKSHPRELVRQIFFVQNEQAEPMRTLAINAAAQVLPRGFWKMNLKTHLQALDRMMADVYDLEHRRLFPAALGSTEPRESLPQGFPFHFVSDAATPNLTKAMQTMVRAQATTDQALIVCALERYKMEKGEYPATLSALTPFYCQNLPYDLITGESPVYHRNRDGTFALFSLGWDGKADGKNGEAPPPSWSEEADLVWPYQEPARRLKQN